MHGRRSGKWGSPMSKNRKSSFFCSILGVPRLMRNTCYSHRNPQTSGCHNTGSPLRWCVPETGRPHRTQPRGV
uniref:Uncharacterized protein MANES_09G123700 n=1 Tax=Rhizophora mucronata TaxID=61149 RepID=A0A2P2JQD1_RHIMU